MHLLRPAFSALALLALLTSAAAQHLTVFEGPAPGQLDVRVLAENALGGPGTVVLQNAAIAPIEVAGRAADHELQQGRSRRIERDGMLRVELPGGGRLFQYRRAGGQFWGYLLVAADGRADVVLELPGAAFGTSPFGDRIGVAADGRHAAVARLTGGLDVLRLDGSSWPSTGAAARFVPTVSPVLANSVMVGPNAVFFVTADDRLHRLSLADNATPVDRTPPLGPGDELKEELAMSGDGTKVAFLAGPRDLYRIWLLGESGAAQQLPPPPSQYDEPNYLPEGSGQLSLLLNDDGTRLFYVDETGHDELFLLDTTGALPALQITADPIFEPTIGIHILPSFVDATLIVSIGRLDLMDWFRVQLDALGGTVTNLTGTGSFATPFPQGTLIPTQLATTQGALLATDRNGTTRTLRAFDPANGTSAVLAQGLGGDPRPGAALDGAAADLLLPGGSGGDRLHRGEDGALLAALPAGLTFSPPVETRDYAVTRVSLGGWSVVVLYLQDGTVVPGPLRFGVEQLAVTGAGSLLIHSGQQVELASLQGLQAATLPAAAFRVFVSGAAE